MRTWSRRTRTVGVLLAIACVAIAITGTVFVGAKGATPAAAATTAPAFKQTPLIFLQVTGQKQGVLRGNVGIPKGVMPSWVNGTSELYGFDNSVAAVRDATSGLPTGQRQPQPLVIYRHWDNMSTGLYGAFVENENLPTVVISFFRPGPGRTYVRYAHITLTNAVVASYDMTAPAPRAMLPAGPWDGSNAQLGHWESLSFVYSKITITNDLTGASYEDDWQAPHV